MKIMSKRNQGTALLLNKNQVCDMYDYVCTALSNHFDACKKEYIKHMDKYEYRDTRGMFGIVRSVKVSLTDEEFNVKVSKITDDVIKRYIDNIDFHSRSYNRLLKLHDLLSHAVEDNIDVQLCLSDYTYINGWVRRSDDFHVIYNSALY